MGPLGRWVGCRKVGCTVGRKDAIDKRGDAGGPLAFGEKDRVTEGTCGAGEVLGEADSPWAGGPCSSPCGEAGRICASPVVPGAIVVGIEQGTGESREKTA